MRYTRALAEPRLGDRGCELDRRGSAEPRAKL